ncbi:MAG: helix-turn-helix domain-containing protein [Planctomycetota bacterium]|nr:helix-turn-helix domain-containing protein [Planctomycetota bacterium]
MRRDERLEAIVDAAAAVISRKGYHGATMRDVAEACDLSAANLYRYLSGKEDMLYQVQRRILEAAVTSAQAALFAPSARDRLRAVVTDHIRRVVHRPGEAEIIRGGGELLRDRRQATINNLRQEYIDLVGVAIDDVVRPARRRRADTERRVHLLLGMADRLAFLGAAQGGRVQPARLAASVLTVFLEGAASRKRAR